MLFKICKLECAKANFEIKLNSGHFEEELHFFINFEVDL